MRARKEKWRWKKENMARVLLVGRLSSRFPKVSTDVTRTSWNVSFEKGSVRFGMGDELEKREEEGVWEGRECCLGGEEWGKVEVWDWRVCLRIGSALLDRNFHKLALGLFFGGRLKEADVTAFALASAREGSIEREAGLLMPSIDWVLDSENCLDGSIASFMFPSNFNSLASKFNNLRTLLLLSDSEGLFFNVLLLKGMLTEETPEVVLFSATSLAGLAVILGFGCSTIRPFESL